MTFGERLKNERERIGLSQERFAILGGVTRQSQAIYEGDKRSPDSKYLTAIAAAGADIQYIVTGRRSGEPPPVGSSLPIGIPGYPEVGAEDVLVVLGKVEEYLDREGVTLTPEKKVQAVRAACIMIIRNQREKVAEEQVQNLLKTIISLAK